MILLTNPDKDEVAEAVVRLLAGVKSIAALSRVMQRSRGTLYKWQNGQSVPSIEELCTLANALEEHIRIDLGPTEDAEQAEDLAVMLGRVIANQDRQIRMLRELTGTAT